jgi:hypothetical protein
MKTWQVVMLLGAAAAMISKDSGAEPDAGAKVVIPERVDTSKLPAFDAEPFPSEKSKTPTASEWKDAVHVRLTRVAPPQTECNAYRLREWMKIHCERRTAGLRLIAGSTDGVALWIPEASPEIDPGGFATMGKYGEVVFPVRPGDRRVFEAIDLDFGEWEGWGTSSAIVIEEQWLEGAKTPEIALLGR